MHALSQFVKMLASTRYIVSETSTLKFYIPSLSHFAISYIGTCTNVQKPQPHSATETKSDIYIKCRDCIFIFSLNTNLVTFRIFRIGQVNIKTISISQP